jgi:hypothetical protein
MPQSQNATLRYNSRWYHSRDADPPRQVCATCYLDLGKKKGTMPKIAGMIP